MSRAEMSKEQFQETQKALVTIAMQADALNLDAFLDHISHTETIAPIMDPTLYMKAAPNLTAIKNLATAVREVARTALELRTAVLDTALRGHMLAAPEGKPTLVKS